MRAMMLATIMAVGLGVTACKPVPANVDTPMDGDKITLAIGQPMAVRWPNGRPADGAWVIEKGPSSSALRFERKRVEPATTTGQQLEVFEFASLDKGADAVTFLYRHSDGAPSLRDERITLNLEVR